MNAKFNLGLISSNRNTIYGLSMLWIMLFHSTFLFSKSWMLPLLKLKEVGSLGVDIFLFVSGISLYYSLSKGGTPWDFYLRRLRRILLPTLLTAGLWYALLSPHRVHDVGTFLLNVSGLNLFVNGGRLIWFVTAISCCYAITPPLNFFFRESRHSPWALVIVLCASLLLNSALRHYFPVFWKHSEILFRRIPIFLIGAWCGKFVYEKKTLPLTHAQVALLAVALLLLFFFTQSSWSKLVSPRYAYIPLTMAFTGLFSLLGNVPPIRRVAGFFAPITLEVYLCQEKWNVLIQRAFPSLGTVPLNLAAFALAILTAKLLLRIENTVTRRPHGH